MFTNIGQSLSVSVCTIENLDGKNPLMKETANVVPHFFDGVPTGLFFSFLLLSNEEKERNEEEV
jgi:hypothetical protein